MKPEDVTIETEIIARLPLADGRTLRLNIETPPLILASECAKIAKAYGEAKSIADQCGLEPHRSIVKEFKAMFAEWENK